MCFRELPNEKKIEVSGEMTLYWERKTLEGVEGGRSQQIFGSTPNQCSHRGEIVFHCMC